jgi:putative NIF3 family GTP cyclohydrolase 1 type 2
MAGAPQQRVTKIATTFMATVDVIRQAAAQGVDMIITHEPTWFTGKDDTAWLAGDAVYMQKLALLNEAGIAVWRFHDHMHMDPQDGIFRGFDVEAGWTDYLLPDDQCPVFHGRSMSKGFYRLPATTLGALAAFLKERLGMPVMRAIGDPAMAVERVALLPGGGSLGLGTEQMPMEWMREANMDVLLCGEVTEWTLPAYVRDAHQLGMAKAILILGHERSEAWGMKHMVPWMRSVVAELPVVYIEAGEPFAYL